MRQLADLRRRLAAAADMLADSLAAILQATGPAVFSRSGLLTIAAGASSGTVTGVALTVASLVLATLQMNVAKTWIRAAVPNIAGSSFTVYLNTAAKASTSVAWFVVN